MESTENLLTTVKVGGIGFIEKKDTHYSIQYETGESAMLNILNDHVIKFYMSPTGVFSEYPEPNNPGDIAKIITKNISDYGFEAFEQSSISNHDSQYIIHINDIQIVFDKITGKMKIYDEKTNKDILVESDSLSYADNCSTQTLLQRRNEYFFGGGMQNGRFSHKGEKINIVNTNKWDDGGVTSPCPFYWSSYGYGVLRNTWQPGVYDFGFESSNLIKTIHMVQDFHAFFFINSKPGRILSDYYELTGSPIMMPEYAFYEAHLNTFNRDYWVEVSADTPGAILFEDGLYYKTYKPTEIRDNCGILESLNGEEDNNYQFSARAMIDRYQNHDMPLGWFIPNDGYGSGYGQSDSFDGDIENLKKFTEYSLQKGVQVGLWTESNLHPADPSNPEKGERDLNKEVGVANIVALKCDVAWIGCGYSFALNAVENATNTFIEGAHQSVRPLIIMVDGWAGTQRNAGIWSGDQVGGEWEYIRFHIPTYIGTGLSGQPIVGSDMDGIYGGGNKNVNIRDYQWKTFTPLQLNMDGWGKVPKTPFSNDVTATLINRAYLKLKSMLMPYNYTLGNESIKNLPMVRAMFLEFPNETMAYTKDSQYQYMWGPSLLIAPIYKSERSFDEFDIRDGIFLPDPNQLWVDFLTGKKYQGGKVYNNIDVPLWKLPVFVKDGSIIPMTCANNNPFEIKRDHRIFTLYPNGESGFEVYEDDGISTEYSEDFFARTKVSMVGPESNDCGDLLIKIKQTKGTYKDMVKERSTLLQIKTLNDVEKIKVAINGDTIEIKKVYTDEEFENADNVWYYKEDFLINPYLIKYKEMIKQSFLLIKIHKIDVTSSEINVKIKNYNNKDKVLFCNSKLNQNLQPPRNLYVDDVKTTFNSIVIKWDFENEADYFEVERNEDCFTNIHGCAWSFDNLKRETEYSFRIRSVNRCGMSEWSDFVHATTIYDSSKFLVTELSVIENRYGNVNSDGNDFTTFFLGDIYELEKIEYKRPEDAAGSSVLRVQYKFSEDGTIWSEESEIIEFDCDNSVKTILLNGIKLGYLQLKVLAIYDDFLRLVKLTEDDITLFKKIF